MISVYVLLSVRFLRTYVGQTEDIAARFALHQAGRVLSTRAWGPWEILHLETYPTRAEAMRREKWFKSRAGRKFMRHLIATKRTR